MLDSRARKEISGEGSSEVRVSSRVIEPAMDSDRCRAEKGWRLFIAEQFVYVNFSVFNDFQVKNQPDFIKERWKLFEILKKDHQLLFATYEKKGNAGDAITVRVAGGQAVAGEAWVTTPYQVAADLR